MQIKFTPTAYAQILRVCQEAETEIGFWGITDPDNPLLIVGLHMPKQACTVASCSFDETGIGESVEELSKLGLHVSQYGRVWIHTHPGNSPNPSGKDEQTFSEDFKGKPFAVMMILAKGGQWYARAKWDGSNVPLLSREIDVSVCWDCEFEGSDWLEWTNELSEKVTEPAPVFSAIEDRKSAWNSWQETREGHYKYQPQEPHEFTKETKKKSAKGPHQDFASAEVFSEFDIWRERALERACQEEEYHLLESVEEPEEPERLEEFVCLACFHKWVEDSSKIHGCCESCNSANIVFADDIRLQFE